MAGPRIISGDEARNLMETFDTAPPEEQATRLQLLRDYQAAQAEVERATKQKDIDRLYSDVDTLGGTFDASLQIGEWTPDDRAAAANRKWMAFNTGKTEEEIKYAYPAMRDRVAMQRFNKSGPVTDLEFYNSVKGEIDQRNLRQQEIERLQGELVVASLNDALSGTDTPASQVFSQWKSAVPAEFGGVGDSEIMRNAYAMSQKMREDIRRLQGPAAAVWDSLTRFTEGRNTDEDILAVSNQLTGLSKNERQKLIGYAVLAARAQAAPGDESWRGAFAQIGENLADSVSRSFDFVGKGLLRTRQMNLLNAIDVAKQGLFQIRESDGQRVMQAGTIYEGKEGYRTPTDEEKAAFVSELEAAKPALQVARELKAVARDYIDPIAAVGEEGSFWGTVERGAYGLAGSTGTMVATAINPLLGGIAIADEEYDNLLVQNPELDPGAAWTISAISGAGQAVIEKFQIETLLGRLPITGRFLESMAPGLKKWAITTGLSLGEQNIQEGAQDLISSFVPAIASAIREDMPDQNFEEILGSWAKQRGEVFFAVLPLALLGGGIANFRDFKDNGRFAFTPETLKVAGFSPEQVKRIQSAQNLEEAQEIYREEFRNRTEENIAAGIKHLNSIVERAVSEPTSTEIPKKTIVRTGDQTEWVATFPDGSEFRSAEEDAVDTAIIEYADRQDVAAGDAFRAFVDYFQQRGGENVTIKTTDQPKTLRDALDAGETTIDVLRERIKLAGLPDSMALEDVAITGETTLQKLPDDLYQAIIQLHGGANPLTVVEEFQHAWTKRALAEGRVTTKQLDSWVKEYEMATGETLLTGTTQGTLEAVSRLGEAYFAGRAQARAIPSPLLRFFNQIREFFKEAFARAARLDKAIKEGKVSKDFEAFLAESVGISAESQVDQIANKAAAEIFEGPTFSITSKENIAALEKRIEQISKSPDERLRVLEEGKKRLSQLMRGDALDILGQMQSGEFSKAELRSARTLNAVGQFEALLKTLPPEVRGRVGGFRQLVQITSEKQFSDFFLQRVDMIERAFETVLKKEYDGQLKKLFKRAKPAKDEAGKKKVGKAGADIHTLFDTLRDSVNWSEDQVSRYVAGLESDIAKGDLTPAQEAHARIEASLVQQVGNWANADAERRAAAVKNATEVFDKGYYEFKNKKLAEAEARKAVRSQFRSDTGKSGKASERESRAEKDNGLSGRWGQRMLNLLNFEQTVKWVFGDNSIEGQKMVDAERKAANRKDDAIYAKTNDLESLLIKLGGSQLKGQELRYKLSQKSFEVDGIPLSENQGITATLLWRQEDGKRHMIGQLDEAGRPISEWHYTQEFVDEVERNLSPEAKAVRDYLADQYSREWETINPLYRELEGINLPQHSNYSPITVKPQQASGTEIVDPVTGGVASSASTTPVSFRTRSGRIAEPDFRDALQTYLAHVKQIEHWKAYAKFSREAQSILGNRDVGNSVEAAAGKEAVSTLRGWIEYFTRGGTIDASSNLALNQAFSKMASRAASVALVGRIGTLAIQSTQLAAAVAEMPMSAYLPRLARLFSGNLNWLESMRSPYIQRRLQEMPPIVREAIAGFQSEKPNALRHAAQKLGQLISGTDAFFTAGTYAIVKDYQLEQAINMGLSGAEAEAFALNAAERVTDRLAQPTRPGARSFYENKTVNPLGRVVWAFASDARKNLALQAFAIAQKDPVRAARAFAYVFVLNGVMSELVRSAWRDATDGGDDDEVFDEKNWGWITDWNKIALKIASGPTSGAPILGELFEASAAKIAGEYVPEGNLFSNVPRAVGTISNLDKYLNEEVDTEEVLRDVDSILSGLGVFQSDIAAAASFSHLARQIYGLSENVTEEE